VTGKLAYSNMLIGSLEPVTDETSEYIFADPSNAAGDNPYLHADLPDRRRASGDTGQPGAHLVHVQCRRKAAR